MNKNIRTSRKLVTLVSVLGAIGLGTGCDDGVVQSDPGSLSTTLGDTSGLRKPRHDMAHVSDMARGGADMAHGGDDLGGFPPPNPPPTSCDMRNPGVTGIQVVVRIDEYQGLIMGRNGTHEIAYGTVIDTPWVFDSAIVDTSNVQLAMNVASAKDPAGLPSEIRLSPGQLLEVEGEYIPASTANAHDAHGAAAVIHYSHSPCGYVVIAGTVYK